jgi:hypothetical protein
LRRKQSILHVDQMNRCVQNRGEYASVVNSRYALLKSVGTESAMFDSIRP